MAFVLKEGSSGQDVETLQRRLVALGALQPTDSVAGTSNIDGRFGRITRDAVLRFQGESGLPTDGVVGKAMRAALDLGTPLQEPAARFEGTRDHLFDDAQRRRLAELIDAMLPTGPLDVFDGPIIEWIVDRVDHELAKLIPGNFADMLGDVARGIEGGDFTAIKSRLVEALAAKVALQTWIGAENERRILAFVVDAVVEALHVGRNLSTAIDLIAARLGRT